MSELDNIADNEDDAPGPNDNVIRFPPKETYEKVDPDKVLRAPVAKLSEVVVIGETPDGEFYFAASEPGAPETLWLLERAKWKLTQMCDNLEKGEQ